MQLVASNDPVLKKECERFDFSNPPFEPIQFAQDMIKFLYDNNGIGLSANQIGLSYRVFAMRGHPENFVCFNPRVVTPSDEQITLEESCLTYPGLLVKIKRPRHVRVRFQTPNGETRTETFIGMTARTFQHEMDHLNGVEFFRNANWYHRQQAMKKWKRK